ncbi:MAG: hypothetical protein IJM18_03295 [Clostridia bacterium]|nr:hypothetical protein [Clostridia bacterium]
MVIETILKRVLMILLSAAMLAVCFGCAEKVNERAEAPADHGVTPAPPTEAPTPVPTETPVPTATPAPVYEFPDPIRMGRLVDGPIFPEPAKYLVMKGESDIFYVYDGMGELVRSFHAVESEYAWGSAGFYGEDGICQNVRVSTGEAVPYFCIFQDFILTVGSGLNENDELCWWLSGLYNADFEPIALYEPNELPLGCVGGVLRVGEYFIVLDRGFNAEGLSDDKSIYYNSEPILLDSAGNAIGTLDPSPFGVIAGVYGDKYVIGKSTTGEVDEHGNFEYVYSIYTLEGEMLMTNITPEFVDWFCCDEELWRGELRSSCYLKDGAGNCYDKELKNVSHMETGARNPLAQRYGMLFFEDHVYVPDLVYSGVQDGKGNWLFRVYNPSLASDSGE